MYRSLLSNMFKFIFILVIAINVTPILNSPTKVGIIGGQNTTIEDHPWIVVVISRGRFEYVCGGFLISPSWAITAAQCLDTDNYTYEIRAGSNTTFSSGEGVVVNVEAIVHPEFNRSNSWDHDIALLHLVTPVNISDDIQPLSLLNSNKTVPVGAVINVVGWGQIDPFFDVYPVFLQEVTMPIISNEECSLKYEDFNTISDNMICAEYTDFDGNGPCTRDTGGPVIWNGTVVGIVSWFIFCITTDYPAVFTYLPNYLDWIYNVTGIIGE